MDHFCQILSVGIKRFTYILTYLCAVVIGNLCSCNYSFLCNFPSVGYLHKFPKQETSLEFRNA